VKKIFTRSLFALAIGAACLSAHAENGSQDLRFAVSGGLTTGGDDLFTMEYEDGSSKDLKGGALVELGIGMLYQAPDIPVAGQLMAKYHFDVANARNGDGNFDRYPIEAALFYTGLESWRFGAGIRYVLNPSADMSIDGGDDMEAGFDETLGLLVEVGYQISPQFWLNVRAVSEKYELETFRANGQRFDVIDAEKLSGNHVGLNFTVAY